MTIRMDLQPSAQPDYRDMWGCCLTVGGLAGLLAFWWLPKSHLLIETAGGLSGLLISWFVLLGHHSKSPRHSIIRTLAERVPNLGIDRASAVVSTYIATLAALTGAAVGWLAIAAGLLLRLAKGQLSRGTALAMACSALQTDLLLALGILITAGFLALPGLEPSLRRTLCLMVGTSLSLLTQRHYGWTTNPELLGVGATLAPYLLTHPLSYWLGRKRTWDHLAHGWCGLVGGSLAVGLFWTYGLLHGQATPQQLMVALGSSLMTTFVAQLLFAALAGWLPQEPGSS